MSKNAAAAKVAPVAFQDISTGSQSASPGSVAIRDVLVHLDGSSQDEVNIVQAESVATAFGAHVRGVFTHEIPSTMLAVGPGGEGLSYDFWTADGKEADETEKRVATRFGLLDASTDLLRVDGMLHELDRTVAALTRCVDLVVIGRPYGKGRRWPDLVEAAVFNGGAPVLIVPPSAATPSRMDAIVIGWRDTRECSRAIAAALPILKRAKRVYLVCVSEGSKGEGRQEPAADMARHLSRHDIPVEVRHLPQWPDAAAGLMNEAVVVGADLIVVGAYGHSRLREFILGGVTRDLLTQSVIPVLMAH